jgi:DNA-binding NarL/FixJ family response regulator
LCPDRPQIVLGPQATHVLKLGLQGLSDKEIARRLGMATSTVRTHIARLCEKLGATNRCQLGALAGEGIEEDTQAEAPVLA